LYIAYPVFIIFLLLSLWYRYII